MVSPLLFLISFGWGLGRNINLSGTSYLDFVVPGIVSLSAMNASYNATGVSLNISRLYFKTLEEFLVSPISTWALALGNILGGCFQGLLSALIILFLAQLFGAHLHYNFAFFLTVFLTCFMFAALGLVAAMVARSHEDMARFGTFFIFPMGFLCGTFFQIEKLPAAAAAFIKVLPLTHSTELLRAAALANKDLPSFSLLVLSAYAAVFFCMGIWVTSRTE